MNFDLSEEQIMLKDSVTRFVQEQYSLDARRHIVNSDKGFSQNHWQTFAELGWLSIPFAEEYGGFGGGPVDVMVVMEELGKGLVMEPFVATVLMFGGLIQKSDNPELKGSILGQIIEGKLQGAFAYLERQSRFELTDVKTSAIKQPDGYVLNGAKALVSNGAVADKIIVSARTSKGQCDEKGISLFVIDASAKGVEKTNLHLMDGQLVSNLTLNSVTVQADQLIGQVDEGYSLIRTVVNETMVALCAEALGVMQTLNATTIEYTKTRQQFGVAIASFQALQHRMVDMFMACEQTRSLLYRAVCAMEDHQNQDAGTIEKNILALKVMVGRAGKLIGSEAIQMHGGMGLTDELAVGHYVKRLMMINTTFGDADYQQQKFAALANA